MLGRPRRQDEAGPEVDLSPLIDVTFLLLIFFVLTTSFSRERQLEIRRPDAESASQVGPAALRVALDAQGVVYLDGRRVAPWLLQRRVGEALGGARDRDVLLIADERVPAGRMIEVVDQCRMAGARDVAIASQGGPR
jgi:biopolymer transport protein ExbD